MNIQKLLNTYEILFSEMKKGGYSDTSIRNIEYEIHWLEKYKCLETFNSYYEIADFRAKMTKCESVKAHRLKFWKILMDFEENSKFPVLRENNPLRPRSNYSCLSGVYKTIINEFVEEAEKRELSQKTIRTSVTKTSTFFLYLQNKGIFPNDEITEKMVISFFTDEDGKLKFSHSYKADIRVALLNYYGGYKKWCQNLLLKLPDIVRRKNNIQFLQEEEDFKLHDLLQKKENSLSLRDEAIGKLLYFTGLRACDIANMKFENIDWNNDVIKIIQSKTGNVVELPLISTVGNSIYAYIKNERPSVIQENHIFLKCRAPFDPITFKSLWQISAKIYRAAGIRVSKGDRKGTHLFRHNLASKMVRCGVLQPVVTETLGHSDPESLKHYLESDIQGLRKCTLSIKSFPVKKEVFENV